MKIVTILGTRPEIIRLSRIIPKLDSLCDHILIHTGQNSDPRLSDVFFREMRVRRPDVSLAVSGSFAVQLGQILNGVEAALTSHRPDRVLILGDTNSGLSAIVARRLGVPVLHMEAGNRCYDNRVPEETNRRIIDHSSDVLLPYTERSRTNLLREGLPGERIFVTGNPILEVIRHHEADIAASTILHDLGLAPGGFFLVSLHRAENVDVPERLDGLTSALDSIQREHRIPVIVSTHPRTRERLHEAGTAQGDRGNNQVRYLAPFGFADFLALEQAARGILTDSGTVQEECAILGMPCVVLRDVTERPETIERGCGILAGADPKRIAAALRTVLALPRDWTAPPEYLVPNVSSVVAKIALGSLPGAAPRA